MHSSHKVKNSISKLIDDLENDQIKTIHNLLCGPSPKQSFLSVYLFTLRPSCDTLQTEADGTVWNCWIAELTSSPSTCPYSMSSSCKVSMWSDVKAMGTSRMFFFPRSHRPLITSSVWGPSHGMGPTWMTRHRTWQQLNSSELGSYGRRLSVCTDQNVGNYFSDVEDNSMFVVPRRWLVLITSWLSLYCHLQHKTVAPLLPRL